MGKISNRECGPEPIGIASGWRQSDNKGAFCKTKIFIQNQGMREILPQAYD